MTTTILSSCPNLWRPQRLPRSPHLQPRIPPPLIPPPESPLATHLSSLVLLLRARLLPDVALGTMIHQEAWKDLESPIIAV